MKLPRTHTEKKMLALIQESQRLQDLMAQVPLPDMRYQSAIDASNRAINALHARIEELALEYRALGRQLQAEQYQRFLKLVSP